MLHLPSFYIFKLSIAIWLQLCIQNNILLPFIYSVTHSFYLYITSLSYRYYIAMNIEMSFLHFFLPKIDINSFYFHW